MDCGSMQHIFTFMKEFDTNLAFLDVLYKYNPGVGYGANNGL